MASQANDLYITISDGNETDPGGETLQVKFANLTSSNEKPYMLMVLILQVHGYQDLAKRREDITADGTMKIKRMDSSYLPTHQLRGVETIYFSVSVS